MVHDFKYYDDQNREHKIFMREKNIEHKRNSVEENPREVTLCAECSWKFYESPWHRIRRIDPYQLDFKTCRCCGVKDGYLYSIEDLRKNRIKKDNIIVV